LTPHASIQELRFYVAALRACAWLILAHDIAHRS
jgi:hypothetical protein